MLTTCRHIIDSRAVWKITLVSVKLEDEWAENTFQNCQRSSGRWCWIAHCLRIVENEGRKRYHCGTCCTLLTVFSYCRYGQDGWIIMICVNQKSSALDIKNTDVMFKLQLVQWVIFHLLANHCWRHDFYSNFTKYFGKYFDFAVTSNQNSFSLSFATIQPIKKSQFNFIS